MYVKLNQVKPLGFQGCGMYSEAQNQTHYYRKDKKAGHIDVISNGYPPMISRFKLTPQQFKKFEAGKLSIVPPGCCAPCAGKRELVETHQVLFDGDFVSIKQIAKVLGLEKVLARHKAAEKALRKVVLV